MVSEVLSGDSKGVPEISGMFHGNYGAFQDFQGCNRVVTEDGMGVLGVFNGLQGCSRGFCAV